MDPHFFPRPSRFRGWVSRFLSRWVMLAGLLTGTLVSSVTAQTAPRLVSVSPADGAVDANVTNSLVYVFDQEMDVTVPIFASAGIGNLELLPASTLVLGTWGPDAKTLTLDPVFALPLNVTVSWTLNPAGSFLPIKSKAGTALATVSGSFTTGVGAPGLGSVSPVDNAVVVSPDVTVVFRFNQVMKKETNLGGNPPAVPGAVSWIGVGVDPAKFTYVWSVDGRQLSCDYAGNLPTNTIVGWALNPAGAAVILESATGKPLPTATYSGSFTTAAGVPCDQSPTPLSWGSYGITKRSTFAQETPADPEPVTDVAPFIFSTVVQSPSFGPAVTNGSLTLRTEPAGPTPSSCRPIGPLTPRPNWTPNFRRAPTPCGSTRPGSRSGSFP